MLEMMRKRRAAKAEQEKLERLAPRAGDLAPDFQLLDAGGENPVRLSDFRGTRPVALIFGSHT